MVRETINYFLTNINDHQKLKLMCSKLFKQLLLKLTTESTSILNTKYYKQKDGYTTGAPLSVVLFDICMTEHEKDAILPSRRAKLCKSVVDNNFAKRKTNFLDQLLKFLNNYHPNIKLTYEINPEKFLDTKICYNNSSVTTKVHQRVKTPHHIGLQVFQRDTFYEDLYSSEPVSSDCNTEMMLICQKFDNAGYASPFIDCNITDHEHK